MDIEDNIKLEIGYGIGSVCVYDAHNKINYTEYFNPYIPFIRLWLSKKAEKRAINKAMKHIANKVFASHQKIQRQIKTRKTI